LCGISVKELYLKSNKNNSKPDFPKKEQKNNIQYENFTFDNYEELLQKIKMYLYYLEQIEKNTAKNSNDNFSMFENFWNERKKFANYSINEKNILTNLITEIPKNWEILQKNLVQNIGKNLDLKTISNLLIEAENIVSFVANEIGTQPSYIALWNLLQYKVTEVQLANFQKHGNKIIKALKNSEIIEQTLHNDNLKLYVDYLKKYLTAQEKFFGRIKWKFAKEKKLLQKLAADNQLVLTVENANVLLKKIKKRTEFEKLRTELFAFEWLVKFDLIEYSFDLKEFTNLFETYSKQTFKAKTIWEKFSNSFLDTDVFDTQAFDNFVKNIEKVITLCTNFTQTYNEWKTYFTEQQINLLIISNSSPTLSNNLEILTKILHINFDLLIELDSHRSNLYKNELELCEILANEITNQIRNQTTKENQNPSPTESIIGNIIKNFDNNFRLFWIGEIEAKNPILRSVSTSKLAHLEEELQRCLHEKNVLSIELLHQKLREKTYNNLNFNRLNNLISYRDLKHQVNKKRYVFPLRKLLHQFGEEIFNLVPCWLASPETVSALFEMKDLFDLVIFDEASQCFAEKGLPAVFRGKQVVIAGDSKQLAPFDLYRPRWEEEFDADTELQTALEVESLLDLGANELHSYHLRGHYRSQSLDLIDFSNQLFYGNRLQMIPHYQEFVKQEPAIEYIKVDGVWEKNTNLVEAKKVVNLIKTLQAQGKTNIGVITFNAHQQSLILDLLEENNIGLSEEIFVKNIENVQGDERDIIIFSLAYAPSPSGRMSMQFGLLNLAKGENRLNVAITRAKEKIYVVTSIFPHQLQTESLQNDGAKILQKYLHYALEVSEGRYKPSLPTANKQNINWYLKNVIAENENNDENNRENMQEKNGTKSLIQLPFADITLTKSSNYHLVLTDDNLFYEALSVKEWFAYMPMQLKSKAWNFERIWSRVWWENL
jgi:superfamily I DNA and/or RNA helicase